MAKRHQFEVVVGFDYADDTKRAEPGDRPTDIPAESIPWMLEQGIIVEVKD